VRMDAAYRIETVEYTLEVPVLSRTPHAPRTPALEPGSAGLPAAVTATVEHRCCRGDNNGPSLLSSPGARAGPRAA
jgi:hypothetical protein